MIKYKTRTELNALNSKGLTSIEIVSQACKNTRDLGIERTLQSRGALGTTTFGTMESRTGEDHIQLFPTNDQFITHATSPRRNHHDHNTSIKKAKNKKKPTETTKKEGKQSWFSRKRETLMVVASLIATMGFQAGVNPPGGTWQDTKDGHVAGTAVMADKNPDDYPLFLSYNTIGFMASSSVILMLMTGVPFKNKVFMWLLMVVMAVAITSTAMTYVIAVFVLAPERKLTVVHQIISIGVSAWCALVVLLLFGHIVKVLVIAARKRRSMWVPVAATVAATLVSVTYCALAGVLGLKHSWISVTPIPNIWILVVASCIMQELVLVIGLLLLVYTIKLLVTATKKCAKFIFRKRTSQNIDV